VTSTIVERVRAVCLSFPEATDKVRHGAPAFFVKKEFVMLWANGHHDHYFPYLWFDGDPRSPTSSDAAAEGYEGWGGYGSSKAALEQLSNVLAAEEPDVRVYWFDPGDMRTEMHQAAFPDEDISDRPLPRTVVPSLRRLLAEAPPSGRYRAAQLQEIPT
jgi:NAD(P)-dependent dehydrogenase (short-subunit alcohol dehydrogenase family)